MNTIQASSLLVLAVAIAAAIIFTSPNALVKPVLAQTTTEGEAQDSTEEGGADTDTASQDYEEFERCLTDTKGGEDFATEDEIREC